MILKPCVVQKDLKNKKYFEIGKTPCISMAFQFSKAVLGAQRYTKLDVLDPVVPLSITTIWLSWIKAVL